MPRKASRNAIENRGKKTFRACPKCQEVSNPVKCVINGKNKMGYHCECGVLDKNGGICIIPDLPYKSEK